MIKENINKGIAEIKSILNRNLGEGVELYLFGSVARKEYVQDSDIDILVLVPGEVNTGIEERIIDLIYEVELKYSLVFGVVVYSKKFWSSEKAKVMPFYKNIQNDAQRI